MRARITTLLHSATASWQTGARPLVHSRIVLAHCHFDGSITHHHMIISLEEVLHLHSSTEYADLSSGFSHKNSKVVILEKKQVKHHLR